MYKHIKPLFIKAISGIHAGTGTDLGLVDMPIQRERHSGLPKIESSGVKGCIRDAFDQIKASLPADDFVTIAFGPDDDGSKHSGSVAFSDARLLLFPVRSAKGIFAYATCPYVLNRLKEDLSIAGIDFPECVLGEEETAEVSSNKLLIGDSGKVVLEEFTIPSVETPYAANLAELIAGWLKLENNQYIKNNLIILKDDDFNDFAKNNTEIITRIRIDGEKGTVVKGQLFTEELLPAETVLYSLVMSSKIFIDKDSREDSATVRLAGTKEGEFLMDVISEKMPKYIQLGGNATIGKGLCHVEVGV